LKSKPPLLFVKIAGRVFIHMVHIDKCFLLALRVEERKVFKFCPHALYFMFYFADRV
jgi:hypothetical protein